MTSMSDFLVASSALQAAGALLTAVIFGGFYRTYRTPFLRQWA